MTVGSLKHYSCEEPVCGSSARSCCRCSGLPQNCFQILVVTSSSVRCAYWFRKLTLTFRRASANHSLNQYPQLQASCQTLPSTNSSFSLPCAGAWRRVLLQPGKLSLGGTGRVHCWEFRVRRNLDAVLAAMSGGHSAGLLVRSVVPAVALQIAV